MANGSASSTLTVRVSAKPSVSGIFLLGLAALLLCFALSGYPVAAPAGAAGTVSITVP